MKGNNYNTAIVKNPKTGELETVCLDTGEVVRSLQINDLDKYKFNFDTALLVCQKIREGATLKDIHEDPTLPSLTVIHYWRRTNPTFDEEIKLSRKERAEYYHDRVLEIADEVVDRDDVAVAKFKADQYRWAAEKGDPSSYGNKVEHTGSNTAPSIVVVTGIERKPDVLVEASSKDLQLNTKEGIDVGKTESN
jgi:folate-binding Fe-S cluster repair protein YgfZ